MTLFKDFLNSDRGSESFDSYEDHKKIYAASEPVDISLKGERSGFIMTFEIMLTCIIVVAFVLATTLFTSLFQTQRYFAEVTSSTCAMAARYGGAKSTAYKVQVANGGDMRTNAQALLDRVNDKGNFDANIYVSNVIGGVSIDEGGSTSGMSSPGEGRVQVVLTYKLRDNLGPLVYLSRWGLENVECRQVFQVPTLIQNGALL